MRVIFGAVALVAMASCSPQVPDSAAGVGFGNYGDFLEQKTRRDGVLRGSALPAPHAISSETLAPEGRSAAAAPQSSAVVVGSRPAAVALDPAEQLAAETAAALNSGDAPVDASPSNPPPRSASSAGISNENNFDDVSARRTIESDAQRRANNQAQYQVVQPTALPARSGKEGPNIVNYALQTSHPVGQQMYKRFTFGAGRSVRNCSKYASPDLAQSAFLSKGGPAKDRLGLDPDGDGYACDWDPSPFRRVSGG